MEVEKAIRIPKRSPSLNEWKNKHWAEYRRMKSVWRDHLAVLGRSSCFGKRHIDVIVEHKSARNWYDYDNLTGGFKMILDALKDLGWIFDDTRAWVSVEYNQAVCDPALGPGTRIILYKLGETPACYYCTECIGDLRLPIRAHSSVQPFDPGVDTHPECRECGRPATHALRIVVQELDDGRGQRARARTIKKAGRRAQEVRIPRSRGHRYRRRR